MKKESVVIGMIVEETYTYSFTEVCQKYSIPRELLIELIEHGLFPDKSTNPENIMLDQKSLRRMESAFRLHQDLGINLPGVALALDLLDELETLRKELDILHKHF